MDGTEQAADAFTRIKSYSLLPITGQIFQARINARMVLQPNRHFWSEHVHLSVRSCVIAPSASRIAWMRARGCGAVGSSALAHGNGHRPADGLSGLDGDAATVRGPCRVHDQMLVDIQRQRVPAAAQCPAAARSFSNNKTSMAAKYRSIQYSIQYNIQNQTKRGEQEQQKLAWKGAKQF